MVRLESPPIDENALGAPFRLLATHGGMVDSSDCMGSNGLVVVFTCNHCPYAQAIWPRLVRDASTIRDLGMGVVAINPNHHPDYPDDDLDHMVALVNTFNVPFPYLMDEDQSVAAAYGAVCTPDIYVLDRSYRILYRGAYDDNWKDESAVRHHYLLNVLRHIQDGALDRSQPVTPSVGCSIKWK